MTFYIKYDTQLVCKKAITANLKKLELGHNMLSFCEVEMAESLTEEQLADLNKTLSIQGIELVEKRKTILVEKIKDAIIELVDMDEDMSLKKTSHFLSEKLNKNYNYLSKFFSEETYTTIENFMILQKIERAKQLIAMDEFTFTEIAWKLKYSSLGHFSLQFKNTTGLTPSGFSRIIKRRRDESQDVE